MKLVKIIIGSIAVCSLFFMACRKRSIPAEDIFLGYDYVPLEVGKYIIYDVDSIIYNDFTLTTDTFKMEMKDEIAEEFKDNEGRSSYVINRYKRLNSSMNWQQNKSYYITKTNFRVETFQDNLRFISLVFPLKNKTLWMGNVFIKTEDEKNLDWLVNWEYEYKNIDTTFQNGSKKYFNCAYIDQVNDSLNAENDIIISENDYGSRTIGNEIYAKNIGLVYKKLVHWDYQPATVEYKKGFAVIMKAKDNN